MLIIDPLAVQGRSLHLLRKRMQEEEEARIEFEAIVNRPAGMGDNNRAADEARTTYEFARPSLEGTQTSILRPPVAANNFKIKPNMIQMVQNSVQFRMPKYAKFLKVILSNKRKLEDLGLVILNEECSAILQNKLPLKRRDSRSFTIPCIIGDWPISGALADLGASINLIPTSLFDKLGLSEPKPTRMSIQLADRTVKIPRGIIEDVLIKVDKFIFLMDFVVMDMEGESIVPLILGRPFLATSKAIIDVYDGKLQLRVDDETITFDLTTTMRHSLDHDDVVFSIDIPGDLVESHLQEILLDDPLKIALQGEEEELSNEQVRSAESEVFFPGPPALELKGLPKLDEEEKLPVIIAVDLTPEERAKTLDALKRYKKAFAYKIADIPRINPSLCSHKILMEDNYRPIVQPQRRLNPNMKEVVKKEVMPKKGGMTVIHNKQDELIPTQTVMGFQFCINYRRLNDATRKDHFLPPFIDEMLERLAGHMFYCFLDGFSGCFQIPIAPEDQEKTTFTCPYGTFAYRRMPLGLCNAPATSQRSPIMAALIELMCDASDYAVGAVLGQRFEKKFQPIYYASKTLTGAQEHYTTIEKELLVVVYAFDKFISYLILSKTIH
ncbi:uncharacterized protein LOC125369525 [Ricinus communis]|uniref:uncharacterized protein LOC125369525 n=1 Tax=Ricinus communis TaxID=3988 RepID=UPI00201AD677|nr:uncharacterized protein LOC125369525 [Ricinus communis]